MSIDTDVPNGWSRTTLAGVASVTLGKTPKKSQYSDTGVHRLIKFRDVTPTGVSFTATKAGFVQDTPEALKGLRRVQVGDVLVTASAHSSDHIGKKVATVERVPSEHTYYCGELLCIRPQARVRSAWVHHFLRSKQGYEAMQMHVRGMHLTSGRAQAVEILLGPTKYMEAAVAKIDALQARSRRAREALDAIPALLERFRQSVLAAAFRGDLTADWRAANPDAEPASELLKRIRIDRRERWIESKAETATQRAEDRDAKKGKVWTDAVRAKRLAKELEKATKKYVAPAPVDPGKEGLPELPEGWCWSSLDEVTCLITSGSRAWSKYYGRGTGVFILAGNVRRGHLDLREIQRVAPPAGDPDARRSQVLPGDLLVTIVGANTGDICAVDAPLPEHYVCQSVGLLRPVDPAMAQWMLPHFVAGHGRKQFERLMYGQGRPHLSFDDLKGCRVPLAPAGERELVIGLAEAATRSNRDVLQAHDNAQSLLDTLDQAILAKAFRGELVPQDPNDEPASELLKHIQAEREAAEPNKKSRKPRKTS